MTAFINRDDKIIFIHTPKTGGTSITDCMVGFPNTNQAAEIFGVDVPNVTYFPKGHVTTLEVREAVCFYGDYYSFAVMREPFSWLISLFEYRYHRDILSDAMPTPHCNFELFIKEFFNINETLQSHWFTIGGVVDVSRVLDFDNLEEELNKYFNLKRPLRKLNQGKRRFDDYFVSQETIELATELLEPDLKLYEELFGKRWFPCPS